MDSVLVKVIATAAWILISSIFGLWMGRKGKPYGVWKPIVHAACFVFIAAGAVFSLMEVFAVSPPRVWSMLALLLGAVAVLCNLLVGVLMLSAKKRNGTLVVIHKTSTTVLAAAYVLAGALSVFRI